MSNAQSTAPSSRVQTREYLDRYGWDVAEDETACHEYSDDEW